MSAPARILIVDDDPPMRELLASILREAGYRDLVLARDGRQAHSLITGPGAPFDLVLLDLEMPGISGIDLLTQCKPLLPESMWVMVSGHSALPNVLASISAGAHGFIVKPYNSVKIFEMLEKFASRRAA